MQSISIAVADSHNLVRMGLKKLLGDVEHFNVIAEATDDEELEEVLTSIQPQVIILDYNQPDHFQVNTVEKIKQLAPDANILVISADNEKKQIYEVLELGVSSYLTKTCGEEEIIDAVKATAKGEKFFCSKVLDYLLEKTFAKEEENCAPTPLTPRELEIVKLAAKGLLAKEIAGLLNLSTHTVYTHRKNIMKKLQINTSTELVLYAVHNGIV
jgi:DNA-binding NarL/FixJ family response regulator